MDPLLLYCRGLAFWLPALALAALVFLLTGFQLALPFLAAAGLFLWLFRRTKPNVPPSPLGVLSPADGWVVGVDRLHDPYLQRESIRISINVPWYGPYTTRAPTEGKVLESLRLEGLEGDISGGGSARGSVAWVETDEGDRVGMAFHRASRPVRPVCVLHVGERVGQGQGCGCMPFGGRVDVLLPADARVKVPQGQQVRGGVDGLAVLRDPALV